MPTHEITDFDWHQALESARQGDLAPAEAARTEQPSDAIAAFFYARSLAEAPPLMEGQYQKATEILRADMEASANPVAPHALLLTLLRENSVDSVGEAAKLAQEVGLPHDLDLLAQTALTLEHALLQFPARLQPDTVPPLADLPPLVPLATERPNLEQIGTEPPAPMPEAAEDTERDNLSAEAASDSPLPADSTPSNDAADPGNDFRPVSWYQFGRRRKLNAGLALMEAKLTDFNYLAVFEIVADLQQAALGSSDIHLVAGMAAEECGELDRARTHLIRCNQLEPDNLMARTTLGRVYWHAGQPELALDLWRSLPVEGPYDHARHYHLALGYEALGDRRAALVAMRVALTDFFYDTRHFSIQRAFDRWCHLVAS